MTDKHKTDASEQQAVGVKTTPSAATKTKSKPGKSGGGGKFLLVLLLLIMIGGTAAGGYYLWLQQQQQQLALNAVDNSLGQQRQTLAALKQVQHNQASKQSAKVESQAADLALLEGFETRLTSHNQRLDSQNRRLLAMSTTSREDWLLAEAEYLLRLAQQRLLMERGTGGAQALLEAADTILRDLDDAGLFPAREALTRDLAALKLAGQVDREGLYMRLVAVADQVQSLNLLTPTRRDIAAAAARETGVDSNLDKIANTEAQTFSTTLQRSLQRAADKLGSFVRVRRHSEPVAPLLTPEHQVYLSQNLRLMLERAQLAMLREEPRIYRHSLGQAQQWLQAYYQLNTQTQTLLQELQQLEALPVTQTLPDISGSLNQLKAYTERLHKLGETPNQSNAEATP